MLWPEWLTEGAARAPRIPERGLRRRTPTATKELIQLPQYGQNRIYERVALAVAVLAIIVVGAATIADDAEAQAGGGGLVTPTPDAGAATTTPAPATTTSPDAATTTTPEATTTPETTTPEAIAPDKSQQSGKAGKADAQASGGRLKLKVSNASPGTVILNSSNPAHFKFSLAGTGSRDVVVRVIDTSSNKTVQHWKFESLRSKKIEKVGWNGKLGVKKRGRGGSAWAKDGKYTFKVYKAGQRGGDPADASKAKGKSRVSVHTHQFPIAAHHTYGDGFGAGRNHQGQDVFAKCGKKLRAVRGGRVQTSSYQSSAGNYVVIDGKGTRWDYAYMHLLKRGQVKAGQRVKTGDVIGFVGETGNAVGCHLHFELWSPPGWYEGGEAKPPTKALKKWDRYS